MGGTPHYSGARPERDSHPNPCNCLIDPSRDLFPLALSKHPYSTNQTSINPDDESEEEEEDPEHRLKRGDTLSYYHYSEEKYQEVSFTSWMVLPAHEDQVGLVIKLATKKEGQAEVGKKKFEELSNQWFEPRDPALQYDDEIFIPLQENLPEGQERWRLNPQTPIENLLNYREMV
ncbi:hypothetical protein JCM5353_001011 [Sporobolomyces roseus]